MDVILDANAIIRDYWLRGRAARRLLSEVESGEIGLFIPKVVVAEVITHYRADVQRAHDARETSDTASSRVLAQHVDQPPLDVAALVMEYGQYLRDTLARATFARRSSLRSSLEAQSPDVPLRGRPQAELAEGARAPRSRTRLLMVRW